MMRCPYCGSSSFNTETDYIACNNCCLTYTMDRVNGGCVLKLTEYQPWWNYVNDTVKAKVLEDFEEVQ